MAKSKTDKILALFIELPFEGQKQVLESLTSVFGNSLEQEVITANAKKRELEELKEKYNQ